MINYELAKELKENGFPQECVYPSEVFNDLDRGDGTIDNGFFVRKPTLSELINEMPSRQKYLGTVNDAHFVLRKLVSASGCMYRAYYEDEDTGNAVLGYEFNGNTPEEAIAKLWLVLNKKVTSNS